jgi:hypothetical protein
MNAKKHMVKNHTIRSEQLGSPPFRDT